MNAKAYNGNTALHVAASLQYRVTQLDAVRLLMRKGADPSTRNLENEQPVHLVPDGPVGEQVRAADVRRERRAGQMHRLKSNPGAHVP